MGTIVTLTTRLNTFKTRVCLLAAVSMFVVFVQAKTSVAAGCAYHTDLAAASSELPPGVAKEPRDNKLPDSNTFSGMDFVVPITMEFVSFYYAFR